MKKLAYITLIAAFIFGVQTQQAFSATDNAEVEVVKSERGEAKVVYNYKTETLILSLRTAHGTEKVMVTVAHNNAIVAKEVLLAAGRMRDYHIDLAGMPAGEYQVKVSSKTIALGERFKKK